MIVYTDKNDITLKDGDIIDLHQTVNGCSKFVVLTIKPLDIRYAHDANVLYEYDKEGMLKPCEFGGEVEWEIVGNIGYYLTQVW